MLFISAIHVELLDIVYRDLVLLQLDLVGIGGKLVREVADVVGEGGGEKYDLNLVFGKHANVGETWSV